MGLSKKNMGSVAAIITFTALPVRAEASRPRACGTAYSNLESDFTEAAARLAAFLCKHPNQFQVMARRLVRQTNQKINRFNRTHPAGSCDPDVPTPVPPKNTAHVMTVLQDNVGAIPLDRYCNQLLDGDQLCGNNREDPGEVCDGSDLSGQSCETLGQGAGTLSCAPDCRSFQLASCSGPAYCGNGRVDAPEACDGPGNTVSCDFDCTVPECGDGLINPESGEQCEPGASSVPCTAQCTLASCGNGRLEYFEAGEQCDDGNSDNSDGCTNSCTISACGDGIIRVGVEECDDGNLVDSDDCTSRCSVARCGDGILNIAVEQCDDGNLDDSDDCTRHCEDAFCGDGLVRIGIEECDDRNSVGGDGCSATCQLERP